MAPKPATFTFALPARSAIPGLVTSHSLNLHLQGTGVDGERLLLALAGNESGFGRQSGLRVEAGYSPGGKYFTPFLKAAFAAYGKAACGSWGPFQIMYPTAYELGFRGYPWGLFTAEISLPWVVAMLNRRIFPDLPKGLPEAEFVAKVGDGYNTGSSKKGAPPKEYIADFFGHYQKPLSELKTAFSL